MKTYYLLIVDYRRQVILEKLNFYHRSDREVFKTGYYTAADIFNVDLNRASLIDWPEREDNVSIWILNQIHHIEGK